MQSLEMKFYDAWAWTHLLGSAILVFVFYHVCNLELWTSCVFAFLLGIIWELFDELKATGVWDFKFLDSMGFNWGDIATDAVGIGLAALIIIM